MAINYKKCLKCGSLNVIKILYGMPTHEAFQLADEGKIRLGGCCITGTDPEYYCKDCENEWDRDGAVDHAYNEIRGIKATVGGYFGGFYTVEIEFHSRNLKWTHLGGGAEDYYEKTIRKTSMDRFIEGLKMVNLLNWQSQYIELGVCDGTQWSVVVIRDGATIKKHGDNKFPVEWKEFCRLIQKTTGKTFS